MRVLILSRQVPWPTNTGGSQRIFHFMRALARHHSVTLLTLSIDPIPPKDVKDLQRASGCEAVLTFDGADCPIRNGSLYWKNSGAVIWKFATSPFPIFVHDWWSKTLTTTLARLLSERSFDLVVARDPSFAEQARSVGFQRVILDADDLFGVILSQQLQDVGWYKRKALHYIDAAKARAYERTLPSRFERVVIAKAEDRAHFPPRRQHKIAVIPNGISIPPTLDRTLDRTLEEPNRLLFVGTLDYGPNVDAARFLGLEVMPRIWKLSPEVGLDVVGRGPVPPEVLEALRDPRCSVHESPADVGPFYRAATVVVTPIRRGSGTRIKVLEALAYEKALVSTTFAAEGLGLAPDKHYVAADTPAELAQACATLLVDSARRHAFGAAGRAFVERHFAWDEIENSIAALAQPPI
jgi:glycosyltransferase involved in cell wall biosynthesis